ncbi:MAG: hypothetical protein VX589_04075 [Myxococcota bacterium]|nr:hypothetical protein [Myxococcota bacterium]
MTRFGVWNGWTDLCLDERLLFSALKAPDLSARSEGYIGVNDMTGRAVSMVVFDEGAWSPPIGIVHRSVASSRRDLGLEFDECLERSRLLILFSGQEMEHVALGSVDRRRDHRKSRSFVASLWLRVLRATLVFCFAAYSAVEGAAGKVCARLSTGVHGVSMSECVST